MTEVDDPRAKIESKLKQNRAKNRKMYRTCFESEAGKHVLEDLRGFTGEGTDLFVSESATSTAYNLGMRRVLLRIQSWLNMTQAEVEGRYEPDKETPDE